MGEPGKIDLNTVTVERLAEVTGIGESTARRIVSWRREHGTFRRVSDVNAIPEVDLPNEILARLSVHHHAEPDFDPRGHHPHDER